MPKDTKYYIATYGCQMNKSDSERIEALLESSGFKRASKAEDADLILLNTCSVRQTAEDRIYGALYNFSKLKRKKPHLLLGVTGCMAGRDKNGIIRKKLFSALQNGGIKGGPIDLFFEINDLAKLPEMISKKWKNKVKNTQKPYSSNYLSIAPKPAEWWRGSVVIQTGCSKYCTYCVVPYARGTEKNRSVNAILKEARALVKKGAKEIILLGQAVNSHPKFAEILKEINQLEGVNRISFASAHPMHMTPEIIKALALPKMVNYLHLPLQSGNNDILRRMNRNYTCEKYIKIIERVRKARPNIALATDIIVGFSGETRKQFQDTVSLYKKCDFDLSYNAMYSPRTGTSAYRALRDDVSREEKRRRWRILQELMEKNILRKNKKYFGKIVEVLVDGCRAGKCYGLSREYKRVVFKGDKFLIGKILNVKINKTKEWELEGEL
ncbi:MAG: tRNA (N6-isopentenyl adenosine(37)-C2)-methylthiotransferase MiaB [Parcubacteria group bacterium CG10_big_fil_rev_8_21_14_0_10_36_14]|nr:MAG: tRNA (N6-isopentenyl adenosine(37)-C2)-methylthiotransferase MiaB [Parcubacteria group bacterium CG10_big_fil_rev_8_21_14_0_10_36_14]